MSKFSPSFLWRHWNLQYGCRWSPNMAVVDNNKRILRSPQNTIYIYIFAFKVVEGNTLQYDLLTNTELRMVFPTCPSIGFKTCTSQTMSCSIQSWFSKQCYHPMPHRMLGNRRAQISLHAAPRVFSFLRFSVICMWLFIVVTFRVIYTGENKSRHN